MEAEETGGSRQGRDAAAGQAPRRRAPWLAVSVAGLGVAGLLGAVWVGRIPLATGLVEHTLARAGVESALTWRRLDFTGAELEAVRLGAAAAPDFTARRISLRFAWSPLPRLATVALDAPVLRATWGGGRLSFGQLDRLTAQPAGRARPVPRLGVDVSDGLFVLRSPYGPIRIAARTHGVLREDFRGDFRLLSAPPGLPDASFAAQLASTDEGASLRAEAAAAAARAADHTLEAPRLSLRFTGPAALNAGQAQLTASAAALGFGAAQAQRARVEVDAEWRPQGGWRGRAAADADVTMAGALRARAQASARFTVPVDAPAGARGEVRARSMTLTAAGRAGLARSWPALPGLPVAPFSAALRDAVAGGLASGELAIPIAWLSGAEGAALSIVGPAEFTGANGFRLRAQPLTPRAPVLALNPATGAISGRAFIEAEGAGAPPLRVRVTRFARDGEGPLAVEGALSTNARLPSGEALAAEVLSFRGALAASSHLRLTGPVRMSGPLGPAMVRDWSMPLALDLRWGEGLSVAWADRACAPASFAQIALAGFVSGPGSASLCQPGGALFAVASSGAVSGGMRTGPLALTGRLDGAAPAPAALSIAEIAMTFSGAASRLAMTTQISAPEVTARLAPGRTTRAHARAVTARLVAAGASWSVMGDVEDGVVDDASLPAFVTAVRADWSAAPEGRDVVIRFDSGRASLTDRPPPGAAEGRRPAFNPMSIADARGVLRGGVLTAEGAVRLVSPSHLLARFTARHVLADGRGEAELRTADLAFTPALQPFEITETARGVVENVSGPVTAEARVTWTPQTLAATGALQPQGVSLSSATLPIIENVRGEVRFDDLLTGTTPPGQTLSIGLINPGIAVRDGDIRFQLRPGGQVVVEAAQWPFAGGRLAIAPTTIALGAPTTRFSITLAGVDVAALIAQLNIPDLSATGEVGGEFPLVLTPTSARIENGVLRASRAGGTINYAGPARGAATGTARLAFDALTSFRYDNLSLTLNGDLDGEIVSAINFSGRNSGNLGLAGAPVSGLGQNIAGVPFIFNVEVRAPFREIGAMAAGAFDARVAMQQALERDEAAPPPTVPPAPATAQEIDPPPR